MSKDAKAENAKGEASRSVDVRKKGQRRKETARVRRRGTRNVVSALASPKTNVKVEDEGRKAEKESETEKR